MAGLPNPFGLTSWLVHSFGRFAIAAWYGSIADIPSGWLLCDGTNGTPDLRDKFLAGAGDTYAVNDEGGNAEHEHRFYDGAHTHQLEVGSGLTPGVGMDHVSDNVPIGGTTDNESSIPPFRGLCYIMEA